MEYVGNYNQHECEVKLDNFKATDEGLWTCELESYVFGGARGYPEKRGITVNHAKDTPEVEPG